MKRYLSSWTGRIVQMAILTKVVYKIEWNPNQEANTILHGNIKSNLKIYLETKKGLQISKLILSSPPPIKKERKGGIKEGRRDRGRERKQAEISPHLISRYYRAKTKHGISTIRNIDQWNRLEHLDINPCSYSHLFFDKNARTSHWRKGRL